MAAEIEFKSNEVQKWLKSLSKNTKQVKEKTKKYASVLAAIVYKDIIQHFDKEEGSKGKWQEWSSSYQLAIAGIVFFRTIGGQKRMFFSEDFKNPPKPPRADGKILQDKGKLRQGFKPTSFRTGKEGITWFNDAKTKSGFPYAFAHNEGGPILPKRDFMWISDKALDEVEEQTLKFILDEAK